MPRTAPKKGRKADPNTDPLARWNKLARHDKIICWNYFQFAATDGREGWNPAEAGSVFHQRSSAYLLSLGSDSWFRHRGKLMKTLAEKFAELNQAPPDNPTPNINRQATAGVFPALPTLPAGTSFASPPPSPPSQPKRPKMYSPGGRTLKSPPAAKAPVPAAEQEETFSGLVAPTSFGMYKQFNYTTRQTTTHMLVRCILHNGVTLSDIVYDWVTPRVLKLRVAWPEWFQMAEQMAMFTIDDDGNMIFPPEHPLTMDTSERNQSLVEEDGRIWDTGYLTFDQDMKVDDDLPLELLDVGIEAKNVVINVLQIFVT